MVKDFMIRYELLCPNGHHFDAWFRDSNLADRQLRQKKLECAICGDKKIKKAMMAPRLASGSGLGSTSPIEPPPSAEHQEDMAVHTADSKTLLRGLRQYVEKNFENVGDRFAEEARKLHRGESNHLAIYGQTSKDEHRALEEEGIDVTTLPWIPENDA